MQKGDGETVSSDCQKSLPRPAQVKFNGAVYTYVHNLQEDIVGLLDITGNLVVEYKYDAWGKPISTTVNLADTLGKCCLGNRYLQRILGGN